MKAVVLYCDRCAAEGKPSVLATLIVWIRTSLGGRSVRLDVCGDHFAMIVGQSSNGGPPLLEPRKPDGRARPSPKLAQTSDGLVAFAAKQPRFSFEEALGYLGKEYPRARVGRALAVLVEQGKLERHMMGVYQRPGYTVPEPASVELAAAAVLKLVKARPGIRGLAASSLAGIESDKLWKATRQHLREHKLARFKGTKSAMRVYPL